MQITDVGFDPGMENAIAGAMSFGVSYRTTPHLEPAGKFTASGTPIVEVIPLDATRIADVLIAAVAKKAYTARKNFQFLVWYSNQHTGDDNFWAIVMNQWDYFLSEVERQCKAFAAGMPPPLVGDTTVVQDVWVSSAVAPVVMAGRKIVYSIVITYQYYFQ